MQSPAASVLTCSLTAFLSPKTNQPARHPARKLSPDLSFPPLLLLMRMIPSLYKLANFMRLVECCRVALYTNFSLSLGVPRPKRKVMTRAWGKRILAPYTAPFRAAFATVKTSW